jgi:hypothetical protein
LFDVAELACVNVRPTAAVTSTKRTSGATVAAAIIVGSATASTNPRGGRGIGMAT